MSNISRCCFVAFSVFLSSGLGACGSLERAAGPSVSAESATPSVAATLVFTGLCISEREGEAAILAPVAAAVVGSVITRGLNRFGAALKAAAEQRTDTTAGTTNVELSQGYLPRCVQVVRGRFATIALNEQQMTWTPGAAGLDGNRLIQAGIYLTAEPDFFFEGSLRRADNKQAMAIYPRHLWFGQPINADTFGSARRFVQISFVFHRAGTAPTNQSAPSTSMTLGEFAPKSLVEYRPAPRSLETGNFIDAAGGRNPPGAAVGSGSRSGSGAAAGSASGTPQLDTGLGSDAQSPGDNMPPATGEPTALPQFTRPFESTWFNLDVTKDLTPLSLTAMVTEVKSANEFLKFVAEVFSDTQDEIDTALKQTLLESERQKAELQALEAQQRLDNTYDTAFEQAVAALETCSTAGTLPNAVLARNKQRAAISAALAAGRPTPFDTDNLIPLNAESAQAACAAALSGLGRSG